MFLCTKLLRKVYKGQRYYHICNNFNELGAMKFKKRFKSQIKAKLCIIAESATHKMFFALRKVYTKSISLQIIRADTVFDIWCNSDYFSAGGWVIDKSLIQYTIFYMFSMNYGPFASHKWLMAGGTLFYKFFTSMH